MKCAPHSRCHKRLQNSLFGAVRARTSCVHLLPRKREQINTCRAACKPAGNEARLHDSASNTPAPTLPTIGSPRTDGRWSNQARNGEHLRNAPSPNCPDALCFTSATNPDHILFNLKSYGANISMRTFLSEVHTQVMLSSDTWRVPQTGHSRNLAGDVFDRFLSPSFGRNYHAKPP